MCANNPRKNNVATSICSRRDQASNTPAACLAPTISASIEMSRWYFRLSRGWRIQCRRLGENTASLASWSSRCNNDSLHSIKMRSLPLSNASGLEKPGAMLDLANSLENLAEIELRSKAPWMTRSSISINTRPGGENQSPAAA